MAIPLLFLLPAWHDVVNLAGASLQRVQLESVRLQATQLTHQLEALEQLAIYLAEEPDELERRMWSPSLPRNTLSEGMRVVAEDSDGKVFFETTPGPPCHPGDAPAPAGTHRCTLLPLRVASTAVAHSGERVTVMQDTGALSPLLQRPWAWVVAHDGTIVAHADPEQVGSRPFVADRSDPGLTDMLESMAAGRSGVATYSWGTGQQAESRLAAYAPIEGAPAGWSLATSTTSASVVGPLEGARRRMGLAGLVVLLLGAGVSTWLISAERLRRRRERAQAAERLRLTQAAAHSERLALIGTLTAGVAHDIRSPLTAMAAISELLVDAEPDERDELLTDLRDAVRTMRAIADDLTGFSRGDAARGGCPAEAIDLTVRMVRARFTGGRDLTVDQGEMPEVTLDTRRLSQALMNLCVNAVHAGATQVRIVGRTEASGCVILVEDDGPGIPEELRERIFAPFFTTKEEGEGTGLGLHLVRSFIEDAGGTIALTASSLGGAAFRLALPPTPAAPAPEALAAR
jgi:signal transduction histidine kinase